MNFLLASRPSATTSSVGAPTPWLVTRSQVDVGGLGLDHHDRDVLRTVLVRHHATGDDHVEDGALDVGEVREGDPLTLDEGDADTADRAGERQAGDLRRQARGVDREHVVLVVGVQREDADDDLDLVAQTLLEGRAQRPVDEPAGEHGLGRGATLAAEERAGDLADRIHALFDVHGQREEVELVLGLLARGGGAQQHRVVIEVCGDGTGCLLGEPPGLEPDGAGAEAAVVDDGFGEGDLWTLHGSSISLSASRSIVVVPGSLLMRQGGLRVGSGGRPGHRLIGAGRGA